MKKILLTVCTGILFLHASAQVAVSDAYNDGSKAYDFSNSETVTADPNTGVGYVAKSGGEFYHFGPAAGTIIVNGLYNAYNPNNNGFVGTPSTPGVDFFQGLDGLKNTAQEIAGSVAPTFGILKLDNGSTSQINITNSNGANVGLRTDFTNGITTTVRSNNSTGALKFLDAATYTNSGLGDAQYVNGYVSKMGNQAFTFPVGNQAGTDARTLSISAPATAGTNLSVAYWQGSPAGPLDPTGGAHSRSALNTTPLGGEVLQSVSPLGFWDWIPVAGTDNMTVTVSKPQETGPGSYTNAAGIRLVGWNIANNQWELLGNTAASSLAEGATLSGTTNAYTGRNMSSYSAIGWGSVTQFALPVSLLAFEAKKAGNTAVITWKTSSEINSNYFEVERSTDGNKFIPAGRAGAAGNTTTERSYTFTDISPAAGVNYYRLKSVDLDGKFTLSFIRNLRFNGETEISIFPNPARDIIKVTGFAANNATSLNIVNISGRVLQQVKLISGATNAVMNVDNLSAGTYILQIVQGGQIIANQKFIKL